jgi:hypothetical protein
MWRKSQLALSNYPYLSTDERGKESARGRGIRVHLMPGDGATLTGLELESDLTDISTMTYGVALCQ